MLKRVKPNSLYSGTKRTLVPEELDESRTEGEPIAVPMNFEFLLENSKGPGKRRAHTGRAAEAVPVPMNLGFLTKPTEIAGKRRVPSSLIAVGMHALVLVGALLVPLWYTEALQVHQVKQTWLVAPPPPPLSAPPRLAPAPATKRAVPTRRSKPVIQTLTRKLVRPTAIPHEIAQNLEPVVVELGGSGVPGDIPDGILGGVPGGVPGGQLGGVIGGVLGGIPAAVPPPVEIDEPRGPMRVGSGISQPQRLTYVSPAFPPAAFGARIQGDVRIDAIIDANGRVVEMKVLSGHPLLVKACMRAVQQWVYEPTYLNEQRIPVVFEITLEFRLG